MLTTSDFPIQTVAALVRDDRRPMAADAGIEVDGRFLGFEALHRHARRIAGQLQSRGLRKGDRVASMMASRMEAILTWFGTALAGGVWVPLNVGLVRHDLAATLRRARASVLVADDSVLERLLDPDVTASLPPHRYLVAGAAADGCTAFDALLEQGAAPTEVPLEAGDPDVILSTGGSTGLPKGVVLPHFACVAGAYRYAEAFDATSDDRHYATSPTR